MPWACLSSPVRAGPRTLAWTALGAALGAVVFMAVVYTVAIMRRGRATPQTELALGAAIVAPLQLPLVPFGVFLAPASVVMLFWGDGLLQRLFPVF